MILYNPNLEEFKDRVDFDSSTPCIWVVYPPGGAGDLLASIVNFHYVETGAKFRGITETGQVIFRSSDQKYSNQLVNETKQLEFDDSFYFRIRQILADINLNGSKMDQFIFSNHCYSEPKIQKTLDQFSNCKIIRLLPKTLSELYIITWLARFKSRKVSMPIPVVESPDSSTVLSWGDINDPRVLTVYFSDFINPIGFKSTYQSIRSHLGIPCAVIDYEFVKFWIDQQDSKIQECLLRLTSC